MRYFFYLTIFISFLFSQTNTQNFELTNIQKEYLKQKGEIKICIHPNLMPFERINNGKYIGISSDIIKIIEQKLQIPFKLVKTDNWEQSLFKIKTNKCDILPLVIKTKDRAKYLNFTDPWYQVPLFLLSKVGENFLDDVNKLKDKRVAIVEKSPLLEQIEIKYPSLKLVKVKSIQEGIKRTQQGDVYGLIDSSPIINYELDTNHINDLTIIGKLEEKIDIRIASKKDQIILNEILNKALKTISEESKNEIVYKWSNIKKDLIVDYKLLSQIVFFLIVILLVTFYWNLKLKEEITNRKKIEEELKQSEEKFKALFNSAPIFLNAFDKDGKIISWNKECKRVFGWDEKELKNYKDPLKLFYPEENIIQKVKESLHQTQNLVFREWEPLTKDGRKIVTKWASVPLKNGDIINIGYDITRQKRYETQLKRKNDQLKKAHNLYKALNNELENKIKKEIEKNTKHQVTIMEQSKLAQMGEMIENIAHQWKQPLAEVNSIVLLLDAILSKKNSLDEEVEKKLSEIEQLTNYMSTTINDFKNFFEPNKKRDFFNIYKSIIKTLKILNRRLSINKIKVDIKVNKNSSYKGYPEELNQVLLIIINNSIDALVEKNILKPIITIDLKEKEKYINLSISDNAKGIKKEIVDKIFEPYFTTKHKFQGTGLGLYISKMIVEKGFKGSIYAQNIEDGVCFTLKLPKE